MGKMWRTAMTVGASALVSVGAMAQDDFPPDLPSACTSGNVAGIFGVNEQGTRTSGSGRAAYVAIIDLQSDGYAAIQAKAFAERGGELQTLPFYEGEWTVEENCFGFIDFPVSETGVEVDFAFVAVENASELLLIRNNPLAKAQAKLLFRR
jgi:hypothetical protein